MRKTEHLVTRSYLVELTVEQVALEIKFPCSISVSLKIGRDEVFSDEEVKPINHRAELTKQLQMLCTLVYDTALKKFSEKKVRAIATQAAIHVHVISLTGRNTAGVSKLDLPELIARPPIDVVRAPLERCPARNPEISYRVAVRFQGELPYQELSVDGASHDAKQSDGGSRGQHSRVREPIEYPRDEQPSFGGYLARTDSKNSGDGKDREILSSSSARRHRILDELEDDATKRQKHRTAVSGFRPPNHPVREQEAPTHDIIVPATPPLAPSSIARVRTPSGSQNEGLVEAERKVARLEAQRQNQVKQIASLNSQIELQKTQLLSRATRESELVSEVERLKRRLDTQEVQLENAKKAKTELERQLSSRLTDQKHSTEMQHKLLRTNELQAELLQLRKLKQESDRSLKEKLKDCNALQDRVDDLTNSCATNQKRLEMKDAFYKEEVKKYSEKLVESELQKQKLLSELEPLRASHEDKSRRLQAMTRDRDRQLQEERAKLQKKIDSLKQDSEALQAKRNNDHQELVQMSNMVDKLRCENTELTLEKVRVEEEVERVRNKLLAEAGYRSKYEEELKERSAMHLQKSVMEQELESDRRDREQMLQKLTDELSQREGELRHAQQQASEQTKQLKQRDSRISDLQFEVESLKKKLDTSKKAEQRRAEELAELQLSMEGFIKTENSKKHESISAIQKYEQEVASLSEALDRLNRQLAQERDSHDAALREAKSHAQNMTEALELHSQQLLQGKEAAELQLNHERRQLLELTEKFEQMMLQNDSLNNSVFDLRNKLQDKALEVQALDQQLYERREELRTAKDQVAVLTYEKAYELQKCEELNNTLNQLTTDLADKERLIEDQKAQLSGEVEELAADRSKQQSRIKELSTQVSELALEVERLSGQLTLKEIDIKALKTQNQDISAQLDGGKKECQRLAQQNELIKTDLRDSMSESEQSNSHVSQLSCKLKQMQQAYEALSQQNYSYKTSVDDFGRVVSDLLKSQQPKTTAEIEESISQLKDLPSTLTQVLSQLNTTRLKHQEHQKQSTAKIQALQQETAKLESELYNREQRALTLEHDLTAKNEQLQLTVQNLKQEQGNLEGNLQDLALKLEEVAKESEAAEIGKEQLKAQLLKTLTELDSTKAYLEHAEAQNASKESEVQQLQDQLAAKGAEFNSLRERGYSQQSELYRELESTKLKLTEEQERIAKLIEESEAKFKQSATETTRIVADIGAKASRLAQLEASLLEQTATSDDLIYKLEVAARKEKDSVEKLSAANAKILQQESAVERLNLQIMSLTGNLKDVELKNQLLEKDRQGQHRRINQLVDEVSNYEFVLNTMKGDLQTTQQELDDAADALRRREEEKSGLVEESTTKSRTIASLNQEISKLKDLLYRTNQSVDEKEAEITEASREFYLKITALEKESQALAAERNNLKDRLKEEQSQRASQKKAAEKEREQFLAEKSKLEAEAMDLNEKIYSVSSDMNTMHLREEEDQETIERLQNELRALAAMYVAEHKKNEQLEEARYFQASNDRSERMEQELRELRGDAIRYIDQIRRLSAQNNYLHQQVLENPMVVELNEKIEEIKRDYSDELAIMQEVINRERKEADQMRREYHAMRISMQQRIRLQEVQLHNQRSHRQQREHDQRELQERLDTIDEERSSTMSEMGSGANEHAHMNSPDRMDFIEGDLDSLREQLALKNKELAVYANKIAQLENVIAHYESNGEVVTVQKLKHMVSLMNKAREILQVVIRIKNRTVEYSDFGLDAADIAGELRLLESKLIEMLEYGIQPQDPENHTQSRSTGIVESTSQNEHEFDKAREQEEPPESITGLANRLKANLSNYRS